MSTSDFLPFATAGGANVVSQGSYSGAAYQTAGFSSGVAASNQVNKALRQATFVGAGLTNFMVNRLSTNIVDDGNLSNFVTELTNAIKPTSSDVTTALGYTPANVASPVFTGSIAINGAAGTGRPIYIETAGLLRWGIAGSATAEGGANAGTDLVYSRYADAGTFIDSPLTVTRSTGVFAYLYTPTHPTPSPGDNSTKSATTAFVQAALAVRGYSEFRFQQSNGVASGETLSANTWTQRLINTTGFNGVSGASISGNQLVLANAGTYRLRATYAVGVNNNNGQFVHRLRDATNSVTLGSSTPQTQYGPGAQSDSAMVEAIFTTAGAVNIQVQTYPLTAFNGGYATGVSGGDPEVYGRLMLEQIA